MRNIKIIDEMIYGATCPKCGGLLWTDGEWCVCDICEKEIFIEDLLKEEIK